ncbi:MAG: helix-turn-helix transcriptional regulator [Clostridiales bacterium]|nr:helix-turn-helix transcriptional regulator [Clostridiales bacterium]MBR3843442.1 helix-turn-helix transcriptional regulator [Christensenellaceae bacterium]
MKTIRLTLREALEKRNITRYELAKRTGIKYQIIDNYYKNKVVRYDSETLLRICIALDCGIAEILCVE